jgi:hypothetical protein
MLTSNKYRVSLGTFLDKDMKDVKIYVVKRIIDDFQEE